MNRLLILGLIGLAVLCVICPSCRGPAIEDATRSAALQCAEDVGLDPGLISVSGLDVTLAGSLTTEALYHHLMTCIAANAGKREIDNQLAVLVAGALR